MVNPGLSVEPFLRIPVPTNDGLNVETNKADTRGGESRVERGAISEDTRAKK